MQTLCEILDLAPSAYYYQPQVRAELELREAVEYPRYGSRRMTAELRRRGWKINRKHIQRVMREETLLIQVRRYCRTTMSQHAYGRYPNQGVAPGDRAARSGVVCGSDVYPLAQAIWLPGGVDGHLYPQHPRLGVDRQHA